MTPPFPDEINENRLATWNKYNEALKPLENEGRISLPFIPEGCVHNAHMFYLKCKDLEERTAFIAFMKENGVACTFHYVPLHSAPAGERFGVFHGEDVYTTKESERLVRLPMYYNMKDEDSSYVIEKVLEFFKK